MRHPGLDPAAGQRLEVDVPGLAEADDDHVGALVIEVAHHVLLALAVEAPAESSGPRVREGQGRALAVAPMAAAGLQHPAQRVAVADRAQTLGLRVRRAEQATDHLIVDGDETRRILCHQIGHGQRVLTAVEAAAQAPGAEGADGQRLDRRRVAPQPLRRLQHVEHAVDTVAGMTIGLGARALIDRGDPGLELRVDRGADLVGVRCRSLVQGRHQRRRRMLALAVDQAGAGARQPDPPAAPVHDIDPGQIRRAPLAADTAGDRTAVALDVDLDDRALVTQ